MNHDDPKLTAYALGELDEPLDLDSSASMIVEETAMIARMLTKHFKRPRRRIRFVRFSIAASLMFAAIAVGLFLWRSSDRRMIAVEANHAASFPVQTPATAILHLTPALAEWAEPSSISNTNFRGIRAMDVDQLVTAVLQDASRVGSFRSLRLTPESPVAF